MRKSSNILNLAKTSKSAQKQHKIRKGSPKKQQKKLQLQHIITKKRLNMWCQNMTKTLKIAQNSII